MKKAKQVDHGDDATADAKRALAFDFGDDATAADAKRALVEGSGHEQALTQYLRDLSVGLSLN